jgi:hypothetical protein
VCVSLWLCASSSRKHTVAYDFLHLRMHSKMHVWEYAAFSASFKSKSFRWLIILGTTPHTLFSSEPFTSSLFRFKIHIFDILQVFCHPFFSSCSKLCSLPIPFLYALPVSTLAFTLPSFVAALQYPANDVTRLVTEVTRGPPHRESHIKARQLRLGLGNLKQSSPFIDSFLCRKKKRLYPHGGERNL